MTCRSSNDSTNRAPQNSKHTPVAGKPVGDTSSGSAQNLSTGIPSGVQLTPFDDAFRKNPYDNFRVLRERDPVHRGGYSVYGESFAVTEHHTVRDVLQMKDTAVNPRSVGFGPDPRRSDSGKQPKPNMLGLDDPDHKRLRRLVQQTFTPKAVTAFRPRIEEIIDEILAGLAGRDEFDLVSEYANPIPTIVIAEMLGVDSKDHADFINWSDMLVQSFFPAPTPKQWEEIRQADKNFRTYFKRAIKERRSSPHNDLITAMIRAKDEDDMLSEGEIISMCVLLINAGHLTTADMIGNGVLALLQHPPEREKLKSNPALIENAVEEMLRYDAPVTFTNRFATVDMTVGDKQVARGETISAILIAANRDPSVHKDPDTFDITRQNIQHLSFGKGIHHCIGAPLARLEVQIAIQKLFQTFPELELGDQEIVHRKMLALRGCKQLHVRTQHANKA